MKDVILVVQIIQSSFTLILVQVREFAAEDFCQFKYSENPETFFTPAEQLVLLESILDNVQFSKVS